MIKFQTQTERFAIAICLLIVGCGFVWLVTGLFSALPVESAALGLCLSVLILSPLLIVTAWLFAPVVALVAFLLSGLIVQFVTGKKGRKK